MTRQTTPRVAWATRLVGPFIPRQYSYWPNACVRDDDEGVIVFAGHRDTGSPRFYRVTRRGSSDLGPLVPYAGEGEGWYWTRDGWITLIVGARLLRVHPFTGAQETLLDISSDRPGHDLWQAHSSADGRVHSATVRRMVEDGPYPYVETVWCRGDRRNTYIPAHGTLDESQITADGAYLHIKETIDGALTNTFHVLATGARHCVTLANGAVGHSDAGEGFVVGEWANPEDGQAVYWDLSSFQYRKLFSTWNMGHVAIRGRRCLLSDATTLSWINLATSERVEVCPHEMVGTSYDEQVKANLDHTGSVAVYMTNHGVAGGPQDVVVVRFR